MLLRLAGCPGALLPTRHSLLPAAGTVYSGAISTPLFPAQWNQWITLGMTIPYRRVPMKQRTYAQKPILQGVRVRFLGYFGLVVKEHSFVLVVILDNIAVEMAWPALQKALSMYISRILFTWQ